MNEFGARLKKEREAKGLSLDAVASATRINKKYLSALEEGQPIQLPELYVKAFIKDYSEFLGIAPEHGESVPKPEAKIEQGRIASTVSSQVVTTNLPGSTAIKYPQHTKQRRSHQFRMLVIVSLLLLGGFIGLLVWMQTKKENTPVQEVKFSEVVKEWEKKLPDSAQTPFVNNGEDIPSKIDTLLLEGAAVESVWVRVVIDGSEIKEYFLPPQGRLQCEGRQYFELSMDNARGIIFSFNGKRIGALSQIKKPLWNVTISPTTLEQIAKMTGGKG